MKPKRTTRAQLVEMAAAARQEMSQEAGRRFNAEAEAKGLRERNTELKERLAFAEAELQRMAGYIQRVQEDDVVREELVTTGDPAGEQRLVPKRKATPFAGLSAIDAGRQNLSDPLYEHGRIAEKRRAHWVNY